MVRQAHHERYCIYEKYKYLPVRPELVEGRTFDYDTVSRGRGSLITSLPVRNQRRFLFVCSRAACSLRYRKHHKECRIRVKSV